MGSFQLFEKALSWLFKSEEITYATEKAAPLSLMENSADELLEFASSYRGQFAQKNLICRVTNNPGDVQITVDLIKSLKHHIHDPNHLMLACDEILAKVLSYRRLKHGQKLALPILNGESIEYINYQVDTSFQLFNRMEAFSLINEDPSKGCPIMLFRGTDFSLVREEGRRSILHDIDPKGPGHSQFQKVKEDLSKCLEKVSKVNGAFRLIGHSLGGVMLLYTLTHYPQWLQKNPAFPSVAFNFPGTSAKMLEEYYAIKPENRPAFKGFVSEGDVISKFGKLFGDVYTLSLGLGLSPIRAHEELFFLAPRVQMQKVAIHEENGCKKRDYFSNLHKQASFFFYELGLKSVFTR